jgi:NADH:ubiquinone oxidoreductase subunit 2 (subunit N)
MDSLFFTLMLAIYDALSMLVKTGRAEIILLCFLIPSYFGYIISAKYYLKPEKKLWQREWPPRIYHLLIYLFILYVVVFDIAQALHEHPLYYPTEVLYSVKTAKFVLISAWLIESVVTTVYGSSTFESEDIEFKILAKDVALIGSLLILSGNNVLEFFIGVEAVSFATYALLAYEKRLEATSATIYYFLYSVVGSLFICLGFLALYAESGQITLSITKFIKPGLSELPPFLFLTGVLIKLGVGPFYNWVPVVYQEIHAKNFILISVLLKIPLISAVMMLKGLCVNSSAAFVYVMMLGICYGLLITAHELGTESHLRKVLGYTSSINIAFVVAAILISNFDTRTTLEFLVVYLMAFVSTFVSMVMLLTNMLEYAETEEELASSENQVMKIGVALSIIITSGLPLITVFVFKIYLLGSLGAITFFNVDLSPMSYIVITFLFVINIGAYKAYFEILRHITYGFGNDELVSDKIYTKVSSKKDIESHLVWNIIFSLVITILFYIYY